MRRSTDRPPLCGSLGWFWRLQVRISSYLGPSYRQTFTFTGSSLSIRAIHDLAGNGPRGFAASVVNGVCLILYGNGPEKHRQNSRRGRSPCLIMSKNRHHLWMYRCDNRAHREFFHQPLRSRRCWRRISSLSFQCLSLKFVCVRRPTADIDIAVAKTTSVRPPHPSPPPQLLLIQYDHASSSTRLA